MEIPLRRYTELPFLIDYLQTKELVLLNPAFWDDRNDSYYIEQYAKQQSLEGVYALCLTQSPETYHHWRIFSHGSGGACLEFDKQALIDAVAGVTDLRAEGVKYKTIDELRSCAPLPHDLPFLKRSAFCDEREFRLFYCSKLKKNPTFRVQVPVRAIKRITLSPWLPAPVADQVKKTLKAIDGCSKLKIYKSTLVENENWKKFAGANI